MINARQGILPLPCLPGTAAYPPGTCHYRITQFGYPISLTTSGDPAEIVVVFGDPAQFTVGFGARFFFYFGPAHVAATSTSVNAQGQMVATFKKSAVPAGSNTLTVRQADRPRHPPRMRRVTLRLRQ